MATILLLPGATTRMKYSPNIIAIIALLPGFKTATAQNANIKLIDSPKQYRRYACAPPFNGIAPPSSAYEAAPVHASSPAKAHIISAHPGAPALLLTSAG